MTNYNAPRFGEIQGLDSVETEASAEGAVGITAAATGKAGGTKSWVGWGGVGWECHGVGVW